MDKKRMQLALIEIAKDMRRDSELFNKQELNGINVAKQFGYQAEAISKLAQIVDIMLREMRDDYI